jgi:hypothetical protein
MNIIEEKKIKCIYCRSSLLDIMLVESNEDRAEKGLKPLKSIFIINKCWNCNKDNNISTEILNGTTVVQPGMSNKNINIILEDTVVENNIVKNYISISKNRL